MNSSIAVSIIIVNYNVRDFLVQCLNSIFNSKTSFLFEVIVVDNNSTDDSVEFLHKTFPVVNVLELKKNSGFSYANNKGFEASKGKYLLFLNPDTVLQEDTLQTMYDFMEKTPKVGIAGCKVLNADGTIQLACRRGFPTPWVAFTKLFGLQKLFPKSRLFGRYNLTYLDPDEFSYVDAISGSFMFIRRELFAKLGGFDTSFFMYGEDLDICYRAKKSGMEVAYVPTTSIIHYKGQSTIRSIIDNKYHFFKSMEIFSKKHFSNSKWFTFFIKIGIFVRQFLSKVFAYKIELAFIVSDLLIVNLSLLLATWLRFSNALCFPDYAYPTVFIVLSLVVFISMIISGEYFEHNHSVWNNTFALLISFFVLSSLTYFFKDYAFSRGVLLLTIGFTLVFTNLTRIVYNLRKKITSPSRILFVGYNASTEAIIKSIERSDTTKFVVVGVALLENSNKNLDLPVLGKLSELAEIVKLHNVTDIIVTDEKISKIEMLGEMQKLVGKSVRFFYAQGYEDFLASEIISNLTNQSSSLEIYNLARFRFRFYKRIFDLVLLIFLLTIGIPFVFLLLDESKRKLKFLYRILVGRMTFVGLDKEFRQLYKKEPLITITEAYSGIVLREKTKEKLNTFYMQNYSPLLDIEILLKYKRGKYGKNTA